jgi:alpha-beta hydrolase superfamily lysophospholipase
VLLTGVALPRPAASGLPAGYTAATLHAPDGARLAAWLGAADTSTARGAVALFHGYGGEKSSLLDAAAAFRRLGYRVLLLDFRGGGGSDGSDVTIGYREAEDVRTAYEFLRRRGESRIVLYGVSMGAAATMRAVSEYELQPHAVIVECPFGSTYQTVANRFAEMHLPAVPLASVLAFWGGAQHGFWAFGHNPEDYARSITAPVLLMQGTADPKVTLTETRRIYARLAGPKQLVLLPGVGHENYLRRQPARWGQAVRAWLE